MIRDGAVHRVDVDRCLVEAAAREIVTILAKSLLIRNQFVVHVPWNMECPGLW